MRLASECQPKTPSPLYRPSQIMVGLWLSLNVLSFQTSLETWTTAAIINWSRAAESVQVEEEYVWKLTQDIDFSQLHY